MDERPTTPEERAIKSAFYRAVHKGIGQIVHNEIGIEAGRIRADTRKLISGKVEAAANEWMDKHGISTVEQIVERVIDKRLGSFGTKVAERVEREIAKQVGAMIAQRMDISIGVKVLPPRGERQLDLGE